MLNVSDAVDAVGTVLKHDDDFRLQRIADAVHLPDGRVPVPLPQGAPEPVQRLARVSHVPILGFILKAATQSLYVDGYKTSVDVDGDGRGDVAVAAPTSTGWAIWRRNGMNRRQHGLHKAALKYGTSYALALPGQPVPLIRGMSPRDLVTVYADDPRWPMLAVEKVDANHVRLYDEDAIYTVVRDNSDDQWGFGDVREHDMGHVPIVRYQPDDDLDGEHLGIIDPLRDLQTQIDLTTFALKVGEHFGAHRQRYIIGWLAETEAQALKTSAAALWQLEAGVDEDGNRQDIKVGEFSQTDLSGYIESREATLRHIATIAQQPVHELTGSLINLSAEALVAARDSHERMLTLVRTCLGESHEQTIGLSTRLAGEKWDPYATVTWRDMAGRALSQTATALGILVRELGVPPEAMWERIPGATADDIAAWKQMSADGDHLGALRSFLETSSADPTAADVDAAA